MRRPHRLPPVPVTHLEKYHAYTSPPMPEKGGLPTIIVTPADADHIQDFEIHFCSPKATQTTFSISPTRAGFLPRMRSFFRRSTEQSTLIEKETYFPDEEDVVEGRYTRRNREGRNGYTIIPQSEEQGDIPGVPIMSEREWSTLSAASTSNGYSQAIMLVPSDEEEGYHSRSSYFTRRARSMVFLCIPVALVAFHLISHHMGLIPGSGREMESWMDAPANGP